MSEETDKVNKYLIFAKGNHSSVLRLSTQKDAGGWKYHEKRLFVEMIGIHSSYVARTLRHDDIIELRNFLEKIIEHYIEIRKRDK